MQRKLRPPEMKSFARTAALKPVINSLDAQAVILNRNSFYFFLILIP